MSDEEKKSDAPETGAPEVEAQKPAVDPAATPTAEPTAATEQPAPSQPQASGTPDASAKPAATDKQVADEPAATDKPARPAAATKPAAGATAKPAGAKPAAKPAPPPDPRVVAAKAKAEELKKAIEAHFAAPDESVRAITAGAVERTLAADAAINAATQTTTAEATAEQPTASEGAPATPLAPATTAAAEPAKPSVVVETGAALHTPMVVIDKDYWRDVVEFLRTDENWKLNYIEMMAGTDYPDKGYIEVTVYVQSTSLGHWVNLKTRADRANPVLPSLVPVHLGVNWEEREIYDLLGITFTDHPDLRRIMMWDEYKGHPLRKDFNEWDVAGEDADGSSR